MSDKMCGTCQKGVRAVLCDKCSPIGEIRSFDDKACGKYEERTDGVEQVALDMLAWINQHDAVGGAPFALRMFALGMAVNSDE